MTWYDSLTAEQKEAASHEGSSARVLAGPGTGKTRSLIQRIAFLLQELNVDKEHILAITFTRAAARELRERLTNALGLDEDSLPDVSTLHAFALRTLLKHRSYADLIQPLRVADDYEEKEVIFPEIGKMIGCSPTDASAKFKAYEATWHTLNPQHESWQVIEGREAFERALQELAGFYGFTLRGELVFKLKMLLEENPIIAEELGIRHLLVDEYQDLNQCDLHVINLLEQYGAELFVVGDDDQSIYQFRHAYPRGIREFVDGRLDCGDFQLNLCHRCPPSIVQLANRLIRHDQGRAPKLPLTTQPDTPDGYVAAFQFRSHDKEAEGIAAICDAYINAGLLEAKDILILLSRRRLANPIEEALRKIGLTPVVLSPTWPLDEPKGRLVYCLLRLLVNKYDALALRSWLGLQSGIGLATIIQLRKFCQTQKVRLWDGLTSISENPTQLSRGRRVKEAFDQLERHLDELRTVEDVGDLLARLTMQPDDRSDPELAIVHQFLNRVIEEQLNRVIEERDASPLETLVRALQTLDLKAETQLESNAVRIMTMHKAKGLSAELVIIPALEQDLIPGRDDENQSRRLMYVSMTRARRLLFLTHAFTRPGHQSYLGRGGGQREKKRSDFLREMGLASQRGEPFVQKLPQLLTRVGQERRSDPQSSEAEQQCNPAVLRRLIVEAFSDEELSVFCYDYFRKVYDQLGSGMSKIAKVQRLIEHTERNRRIDELLTRIQTANPAQYNAFEPELFGR